MVAKEVKLGVIGGSGIYQVQGVEVIKRHPMKTPFGAPSDEVVETRIHGKSVYFLPRHGAGHVLLPSEVNYRANVYAMKKVGVTHLLAVSAVGIMQEHIKPGDMVIPDQIFDRTKGTRHSTFFGEGIVGHVTFADPFSREMCDVVEKAAKKITKKVHRGGAYVCMEGPQFSTRAESHFYRHALKPVIIGMTAIPEAKLAREAEMCYGLLGLATDYDCWNEAEGDVAVEDVMAILRANAETANAIVQEVARVLPEKSTSPELEAAKFAIITSRDKIPAKRKEELQLLFGQYF